MLSSTVDRHCGNTAAWIEARVAAAAAVAAAVAVVVVCAGSSVTALLHDAAVAAAAAANVMVGLAAAACGALVDFCLGQHSVETVEVVGTVAGWVAAGAVVVQRAPEMTIAAVAVPAVKAAHVCHRSHPKSHPEWRQTASWQPWTWLQTSCL